MTVLFASDVHLSAARPTQVEAFLAFLAGPCRAAERVYLLGDVFDAWLGDDDDRDPHPRVEQALARLTGTGVAVAFVHGNHDFLVGPAFASRTGCELLTQPARIQVHNEAVVVLHGDALCTRDEDYQRWRTYFTDAANQARFLALPFQQRLDRAAALRLESEAHTALKPEDIMDVTQSAVSELLQRLKARHVVHGHTHRPALHRLGPGPTDGVRVVLGDWYEDDTVLAWDATGPCLCSARAL